MKISIKNIMLLLIVFMGSNIYAQSSQEQGATVKLDMGLDEVIKTAREQSLSAMIAKHNFLVEYWQFRTYKAQFLPSLNLGGGLGQYNRSLSTVQSSETGELNYVSNDYLINSLSLSVDQNIALTGGTVSVYTSLYRLDQFYYNTTTYNSQPINISYTQPIRAFNSLKWEKKIEPKKFEVAKTTYLESMESVTVLAAQYFFTLLQSQMELEMAQTSGENTEELYKIAQERFKIGTITKDDLLQLKLMVLNNDISLKDKELNVRYNMMRLRNFLGFNESVELNLSIPDVDYNMVLSYDDVMHNVNTNSSFALENQISKLEAEQEVARAKASVGLQASLSAQFGLTQIGEDLGQAYKSPLDQEIIGLSLSLPIIDWGLGKGQVKVAKSKDKVTGIEIEQSEVEQREEVLYQVMQFNFQGSQCMVSAEADEIGKERYNGVKQRFINGALSVTDLNNAQSEMDSATVRYLQDLSNYWNYYYNIRKLSLYDYINNKKLDEDFEAITGEEID